MKKTLIRGLSIIIPSYNRRDQLLRLLKSIYTQNLDNLHEIVIIDNSSDYDIYEVLKPYKYNKVRIVQNPFNVRMGTNMMNTFFHCNTSWMWIISDDDVICEGALKLVLDDIENSDNICMIKYSTEGIKNIGQEKNETVNNLEEFIDYYHDEKVIRRNNLVFISNGIYNLNKLHPYLGMGFEFSYTYIGFLVPAIFALNNGESVKFKKNKIVKYIHPGNQFWSLKIVGLGLSTIAHLPLVLNNTYRRKFLKTVMPISYGTLFLFLMKEKNKANTSIYSMIYHNIYKLYLSPFSKIKYYLLASLLHTPKLTFFMFYYLIKIKK